MPFWRRARRGFCSATLAVALSGLAERNAQRDRLGRVDARRELLKALATRQIDHHAALDDLEGSGRQNSTTHSLPFAPPSTNSDGSRPEGSGLGSGVAVTSPSGFKRMSNEGELARFCWAGQGRARPRGQGNGGAEWRRTVLGWAAGGRRSKDARRLRPRCRSPPRRAPPSPASLPSANRSPSYRAQALIIDFILALRSQGAPSTTASYPRQCPPLRPQRRSRILRRQRSRREPSTSTHGSEGRYQARRSCRRCSCTTPAEWAS